MKKWFALSIAILFAFSSFAHKFYVSITDMTYNAKHKSLEVIIKCFIDDFEKVLSAKPSESTFNLEQNSQQVDALIAHYLKERFELTSNQKELSYDFLGHETDQDYVWLYIEVNKLKTKQALSIKNTILFDAFDTQENKIRLLIQDQNHSGSCTINEPLITFNL